MAERPLWWRLGIPVVFGVTLGVAISVFLGTLPDWLSTVLIVAGSLALMVWAFRQWRWARGMSRWLKDRGDG